MSETTTLAATVTSFVDITTQVRTIITILLTGARTITLRDIGLQKRSAPTNIPTYASACSGSVRYSSACSCIGATHSTVTAPAPSTTTTVYAVRLSSSSLLSSAFADLCSRQDYNSGCHGSSCDIDFVVNRNANNHCRAVYHHHGDCVHHAGKYSVDAGRALSDLRRSPRAPLPLTSFFDRSWSEH